eukprot:gene23880-27021_t
MLLILSFLLALSATLCNSFNYNPEFLFTGEKFVNKTAYTNEVVTWQVHGHLGQKLYGMILLPKIEKHSFMKKKMKFLEIGLGCGMPEGYTPGASVALWKKLFAGRDVDLWVADSDEVCVTKQKAEGKLSDVSTLIGDQADIAVLKRWIQESGGKFDVIVDDGGHRNNQVLNSFVTLWPEVNADGWYFFEILEMSMVPEHIQEGFPPLRQTLQLNCQIT